MLELDDMLLRIFKSNGLTGSRLSSSCSLASPELRPHKSKRAISKSNFVLNSSNDLLECFALEMIWSPRMQPLNICAVNEIAPREKLGTSRPVAIGGILINLLQ